MQLIISFISGWEEFGLQNLTLCKYLIRFASKRNPASELDFSPYALSQVAQAHADDMIVRKFIDHVNPDGNDFFWRVDNAGITYHGLGENIAAGFANMDDAHAGFMGSADHRANVLRPEARQVGIGIAKGTPSSIYGVSYYVVELFLQP